MQLKAHNKSPNNSTGRGKGIHARHNTDPLLTWTGPTIAHEGAHTHLFSFVASQPPTIGPRATPTAAAASAHPVFLVIDAFSSASDLLTSVICTQHDVGKPKPSPAQR